MPATHQGCYTFQWNPKWADRRVDRFDGVGPQAMPVSAEPVSSTLITLSVVEIGRAQDNVMELKGGYRGHHIGPSAGRRD